MPIFSFWLEAAVFRTQVLILAMSPRSHALLDSRRSCLRCKRSSRLSGDCDRQTEMVGLCTVCVADWNLHCFAAALRYCSREVPWGVALNIASFVFLTGSQVHSLTIASFVFLTGSKVHSLKMRCHKRCLQLLDWDFGVLKWHLESQSSDDFVEHEPPDFWTLSKTYLPESGTFARSCFSQPHPGKRSLLDAIYAYLDPRFGSDLVEQALSSDTNWRLFASDGSLSLLNTATREGFPVFFPTGSWRRFRWYDAFPLCERTCFYWWHEEGSGRLFREPEDVFLTWSHPHLYASRPSALFVKAKDLMFADPEAEASTYVIDGGAPFSPVTHPPPFSKYDSRVLPRSVISGG